MVEPFVFAVEQTRQLTTRGQPFLAAYGRMVTGRRPVDDSERLPSVETPGIVSRPDGGTIGVPRAVVDWAYTFEDADPAEPVLVLFGTSLAELPRGSVIRLPGGTPRRHH